MVCFERCCVGTVLDLQVQMFELDEMVGQYWKGCGSVRIGSNVC